MITYVYDKETGELQCTIVDVVKVKVGKMYYFVIDIHDVERHYSKRFYRLITQTV